MARNDKVMCIIAKASWIITALASINIGAALFEFNFFQTNFFMMNLHSFGPLIIALIGLSGLYSLITFVMHCQGKCKSCKV